MLATAYGCKCSSSLEAITVREPPSVITLSPIVSAQAAFSSPDSLVDDQSRNIVESTLLKCVCGNEICGNFISPLLAVGISSILQNDTWSAPRDGMAQVSVFQVICMSCRHPTLDGMRKHVNVTSRVRLHRLIAFSRLLNNESIPTQLSSLNTRS